jgi:hypothetical protein
MKPSLIDCIDAEGCNQGNQLGLGEAEEIAPFRSSLPVDSLDNVWLDEGQSFRNHTLATKAQDKS